MSLRGTTQAPRHALLNVPPKGLSRNRQHAREVDVFTRAAVPMRRHAIKPFAPPPKLSPRNRHVRDDEPMDHIERAQTVRDAWPNNTFTALQTALIDNDTAEVRKLVAQAGALDERDDLGHTALHIAAALDSEKYVTLLLEHGANPDANDVHGLTPVYCAARFESYGTMDLLVEEGLSQRDPSVTPWQNTDNVCRLLGQLREARSDADGGEAAADRTLRELLGIPQSKIDDAKKLEPLLLYHAHLLSLTGDTLGFELEGWDTNGMLLQRMRTLLRFAIKPPQLPEGKTAEAAGLALQRALNCDLDLWQSSNRLTQIEELPEGEPRTRLLRLEAHTITAMVRHLGTFYEYAVPTGSPTHACYVCFRPRRVQGENVVTLRLDNLGHTQSSAQFTERDGRVTPLNFNIPRALFDTIEHRAALTRFIETILVARTHAGIDDHVLNSAIYQFKRQVGRWYPDLAQDYLFSRSVYRHKEQLVGNCVLKNHSAGMCARMGQTLFRWFKQAEVADVEGRLTALMAPQALQRSKEEKWRNQWTSLLEYDCSIKAVQAFFTKPGRESVVDGMDEKQWRTVIASDDPEVLTELLQRGGQLPDAGPKKATPLHWAVEGDSAEMVRALLKHGAPIDARDESGNTPLHLAVKGDRRAIVNALLAWSAACDIANDEGETAAALCEQRSQQAAHALRQMRKASERAAKRGSDVEPNEEMLKADVTRKLATLPARRHRLMSSAVSWFKPL